MKLLVVWPNDLLPHSWTSGYKAQSSLVGPSPQRAIESKDHYLILKFMVSKLRDLLAWNITIAL